MFSGVGVWFATPTKEGAESSHMSRAWNWLKKEFREILPVWIFFFFALGLLSLTVSAVLGRYQLTLSHPHEYVIGSLIIAKAVVLMDAFMDKEWLRGRPLIYPTLWNTSLYFLAALAFDRIEEILKIMRRQHLRFPHALRETINGMGEPRYWAVMAWLIALIAVFCAFRELIDAIGRDRFKEMFFGKGAGARRRAAGSPPAAA
jgi:hypothetical protein